MRVLPWGWALQKHPASQACCSYTCRPLLPVLLLHAAAAHSRHLHTRHTWAAGHAHAAAALMRVGQHTGKLACLHVWKRICVLNQSRSHPTCAQVKAVLPAQLQLVAETCGDTLEVLQDVPADDSTADERASYVYVCRKTHA